MPLAAAPHLKEQARAMYLAGKPMNEVAEIVGISCHAVRQWAHRNKWQPQRAAVIADVQKVVTAKVTDALAGDSRRVRETLSRAVTKQAKALSQVSNPTLANLRSTPKRQGLAAVTKTVVDSAAALYGWDSDKTGGHLMFDSAKEIEASVVQEAAPVAADTTTGSVQAVEHRDNTGVISQVVEIQQN